jgi:hypothetical protein
MSTAECPACFAPFQSIDPNSTPMACDVTTALPGPAKVAILAARAAAGVSLFHPDDANVFCESKDARDSNGSLSRAVNSAGCRRTTGFVQRVEDRASVQEVAIYERARKRNKTSEQTRRLRKA